MQKSENTVLGQQCGSMRVIDPHSTALRAAMELSRKEHEDRVRVGLDPKGKGASADIMHDSSDED